MKNGKDAVLDWLMAGDPAVRWQVMRDLLSYPEAEYTAERERMPTEGWGAKFVAALGRDGEWPEARWTGTVWTLCTLMDLGFPPEQGRVRDAAFQFLERKLAPDRFEEETWLLRQVDLCHLGFWLRIGSYFGFHGDRLRRLSALILSVQFADGGWNCRKRMKPKTSHSSFHTTFNVLEALRAASTAGIVPAAEFRLSEARALEFMLAHQMYRSDRTGQVVDERFAHLAYPSHWHYTVLRGMDYMHACPEIRDPRLADPLALIERRRKPNGRWVVEKRIPGEVLFDFEPLGGESRWNTLRARRVLAASIVQ